MAAVAGSYSPLQRIRLAQPNSTPSLFQGKGLVQAKSVNTAPCVHGIEELFPNTFATPRVTFEPAAAGSSGAPLKVGIVLSGGQAPGGHNVIAGIFDYIKTVNPESKMIGFRDGPHGVFSGIYVEVDETMMNRYRNTGGFDMLGSGRHKIETPEQFASSVKVCTDLGLNGLVVIGGDDSNTNAALLAEQFKALKCKTNVVGCPKTIDGDLKNEYIPISFGFDTACRTYAEQVGNLARDALSSQKYYHFVRLMGRSASHIALEVALQTRPNVCLIGEEVQTKKQSLAEITKDLTDMVEKRAATGRNYGIVLLPEGLVEFIPEIGVLIGEINDLVASPHGAHSEHVHQTDEELLAKLSPESGKVYMFLPSTIRAQLMLDRDPHGNVQVTKIETEQLLATCVMEELSKRLLARKGANPIQFTPLYHSFGYEGRSGLPSVFDSDYCYSLGLTAAGLISCGLTSLMASVDNLLAPVKDWRCGGTPITMMMALERRHAKMKPVITKALVKLDGAPFNALVSRRENWALNDLYRCPGPVQFYAPSGLFSALPLTLQYELLKKGDADPDPNAEIVQPIKYKLGTEETFLLRPPKASCASSLEAWRRGHQPRLPSVLKKFISGAEKDVELWSLGATQARHPRDAAHIKKAFPETYGDVMIDISSDAVVSHTGISSIDVKCVEKPHVGVVFSGRQAPGGHNIILGLFDAIKACKGKLIGFVGGSKGLLHNASVEVSQEMVDQYRNTGGFDMLGRTVDNLNASHAQQIMEVASKHNLAALVVIGSVKTMNNLVFLAEKLKSLKSHLAVVGVPAGIDGALQGAGVESTVGFDTACNGYAQLVGNTATDAASARKYYHFLRIMGTEPSQIALEVALRTHPNVVVLGEEVEHKREGLADLVREIADLVSKRADKKKNFGIVLIPEGLAAAIPELKALTDELAAIYKEKVGLTKEELVDAISPWGRALLDSLPPYFRQQLLLEQTNAAVQLSQIETERLVAELVEKELERRAKHGHFKGKFGAVTSFLGYQSRGAAPSNFDCDLAYTLGVVAGCLSRAQRNGYLTLATGLKGPTEDWRVGGIPLSSLMVAGAQVAKPPHLPTAKVSLTGTAHRALREGTEKWEVEEEYINPGPCQFAGPTAEQRPEALTLQNDPGYLQRLSTLYKQFDVLRTACLPGCPAPLLDIATQSLNTLNDIVTLIGSGEAL